MSKYSTLIQLLQTRAQNQGNSVAYRWLQDGEKEREALTYGELAVKAQRIGAYLQGLNLANQRVMIVYPYEQGLDFIAAFFGCLYGGAIAVTCHPPLSRHGLKDIQERLLSAQAQALITHRSLLAKLKGGIVSTQEPFHWIVSEDMGQQGEHDWYEPQVGADSLAFLQYTSGSTGKPKGVMIDHRCILANQEMLRLAFNHGETSLGVGWLPLFHDMGLIGLVIQALYVGRPSIFMSPLAFVQKPVRWLQAISHYRATTSGAPNFAYDLLCRHVTGEQRANLDLSCWQVAFSGAEPIQKATIDQFCQLFADCGFQSQAFYPCYGMAEATLLVTGGEKHQPLVVSYLSEGALAKNRVLTHPQLQPGYREVVGCGKAWLDTRVVIVNPQTYTLCGQGEIGEIWVTGGGIGRGYWQDGEKTAATFGARLKDTGEGPFLRTGDLGFLEGEELFITGRRQDVMVFWGLNHYPQLIEATVAATHPALRANCGAAFAVKIGAEERLIIAQEVERDYRHNLDGEEIVEMVRWAVFERHLVDVYGIILLKTGTIPRTSSGKIQRQACRQAFLDDSLQVLFQWCCTQENALDMTSLWRYYFNPRTHLHRHGIRLRAQIKRLFSRLKA